MTPIELIKYINTPDQQQWQEMDREEKSTYLNPEWVQWNLQRGSVERLAEDKEAILQIIGSSCPHDSYCDIPECMFNGRVVCQVEQDQADKIMNLYAAKESPWQALAKIAPPDKWLEMYTHYQEILTKEDATDFWQEQFQIANAEINELKRLYQNFADLYDLKQKEWKEELTKNTLLKDADLQLVADKKEILEYAELFINMSFDFINGKIDSQHYADTLKLSINNLYGKHK